MSLINFVSRVTKITAAWLNKVDYSLQNRVEHHAVDSGVAGAYVLTVPAAGVDYILTTGTLLHFKPLFSNAGPSTINGVAVLNSLGVALSGGEIDAAGVTAVVYNGTNFILLNNAAVAGLPVISSGVYTPTMTAGTGTDAITSAQAEYIRIGSVVTVFGSATFDGSQAVIGQFGISLPIASDLGATADCSGVINAETAASGAVGLPNGVIKADTVNNRANAEIIAAVSSAYNVRYSFAYKII